METLSTLKNSFCMNINNIIYVVDGLEHKAVEPLISVLLDQQ